MIHQRALIGLLFSGMLLVSACYGQSKRDPLTPLEIDQLRDQAQDADLRMKLFVQFARQRLDSIEKIRSDPKVTDHATATHDALQAFLDVYDEMNDNVDAFEDQKTDFRKGLKTIIEADVEFQAKLRALQNSVSPDKDQVKIYEFLLQSALETVDESAKDHRELLAQQEEAAKHKKKPKGR